jgi:hypothetical protein
MAKETKVIQVAPSDVETTIELWQYFGWETAGAPQEIYNKTKASHLEDGANDTIRSVVTTETTHYFTITFQRDKSMPNYAELVWLEEAYHTKSYVKPDKPFPPEPPPATGSLILGVAFVPLIIGVLCLCGNDTAKGVGGAFLVLSAVMFILGFIDAGKKDSERKPFYDEWKDECDAIKSENNTIQCENEERRHKLLREAESLLP